MEIIDAIRLDTGEQYKRAFEYIKFNGKIFSMDNDYTMLRIDTEGAFNAQRECKRDDDKIKYDPSNIHKYVKENTGVQPLYNFASFKHEEQYETFKVDCGAMMLSGPALFGGDRYPYTVIHIEYSDETLPVYIVVQEDTTHVIKGSMYDGSAIYGYERNKDGAISVLKYTHTSKMQGWTTIGKTPFFIGVRQRYHNPSF